MGEGNSFNLRSYSKKRLCDSEQIQSLCHIHSKKIIEIMLMFVVFFFGNQSCGRRKIIRKLCTAKPNIYHKKKFSEFLCYLFFLKLYRFTFNPYKKVSLKLLGSS